MKTTCPSCATVFRVTPEQLAVRAGKVRCGKCQGVFNAIDRMLDKNAAPPSESSLEALHPTASEDFRVAHGASGPEKPLEFFTTDELENTPVTPVTPAAADSPLEPLVNEAVQESVQESVQEREHSQELEQELALASTLIMPRATSEIPGYSKWTEGAFNSTSSFHEAKAGRWPFILAALLLGIALLGQLAFHFRTAIVVAAPFWRPPLAVLSELLGSDIPLPRHAELISIETSDLQVDPNRSSLLALQATLRNRAAHEQAYPALQLSLTDTQDSVIVRRVFSPGEYLSPQNLSPLVFAANGEISVQLWIEAKDITAAGYRLYAFYP